MNLTIKLKNIGILKQAEFSLGDLTLICGENNTGKTYTAYALYGFLRAWRDCIRLSIHESQLQEFLSEKERLELQEVPEQLFFKACQIYTEQLDQIFAAPENTFEKSEFSIILPDEIDTPAKKFEDRIEMPQGHIFTFYSKREESGKLTVFLNIEKKSEKEVDSRIVRRYINLVVANAIFSDSLPKPFIFSAERTGIATFRKELDFARSRLLQEMERTEVEADLRQLLFKAYQSYPSPIEDDVDFSRGLSDILRHQSFIPKEHPEILEDFANIVGGAYTITQNDQLYYIPKGTRQKLTMVESSSAVRSLLDLSFYLNCIAQKGDLLMIDEPELSLHPENQRRIARLFARLANIGVKVFITTHSDYIVKELNTLIMLNHDKPHLKRVAEENGYRNNELIKVDQIKVYIAEKALLPLEEGRKRRKRGHTLVPAKIHPELGIGVSSFDQTIDDMNRIQDDIVWGEE